jgi:hypothetical protein
VASRREGRNPEARDPNPAGPESANRGGVTARAVAVGLLLIPITIYWITITEVRWYTLDGTSLPLFIQPVFFLFLLCLLNLAAGRLRRRFPGLAWLPVFQQGELLVVYVMLALACVFAGHDMLQNLFGTVGHPHRFASAGNNWEARFFGYLPTWLLVTDRDSLTAFYGGNADIYRHAYLLQPWVRPLLWWALFVFAQVVVFLGFNILIRRQWTENEKLAFPLVQLPLAMTDPHLRTPFWSNRVMWAGFATAAVITAVNGLAYLYPSIPYLAVKQYNITQNITDRPWSAMGPTNISLYPFAIGLAYFIPLDLSFSCWFFFVWRKAQQVLGATAGWDAAANRGWPFFPEQSSGAWIGLILILGWSNRAYLQKVFGELLGFRPPDVPRAELRTYRWALAGIAGGTLLLWLFLQEMGMTGKVAALFLLVYLGLSIAITRIRAELGTPHEINFVSPNAILVNTMGTSQIGKANLTAMACTHWFNRGYRCHPMPNQLESLKMAEGGRINLTRLYVLTLAASAFAIFITYWANADVTFAAGATAKAVGFKRWVGNESFDRLNGWITTPVVVNVRNTGWMLAGLAFTLFLKGMRSAFVWWPFHPAGYALALSFAMDYFWFAFLASWLAKLVLVRYGGMRMHTAAAPYFLGLMLGDYVAGSLWAIYGPAMQMSTYKIFI